MLLERDELLAVLRESAPGTMVLIGGEAGIGKTTLVQAHCDTLPSDVPVRFGFCDALGTPRALGPLHDIARTMPEVAGRLSAGADRHDVFTTFLDQLRPGPSVTVVEDAQWADEGTLDLLLYLGRRIGDLPAVVLVTYRSEEVGRDHPLRRVLGDLATARPVRRIQVPALSQAAVTSLAEPLGLDTARLYALTGGNPFFVTEVLSTPADDLPVTVRDAVLSRADRLGSAARAVLDIVSLVPDRAEMSLVDPEALEPCLESGLLLLEDGMVRFRHELARRAVETDVSAVRRSLLHGRVLDHLAGLQGVDPARLSHHAEASGDRTAVLRYAPIAARLAARAGAHREAAAQYARAVRHCAAAQVQEQAELWEHLAHECDSSGALSDGIAAAQRAIELWQSIGNTERQGAVMAQCSLMLWKTAQNAAARAMAAAAAELLEAGPPGRALAQVHAAQARLLMLAREMPAAIEVGSRAVELAERLGDTQTLGRALNAVGTAHFLTDPDRAVELLEAGLDASAQVGDDAGTAAAMVNLGSGAGEIRRYEVADRWLGEAVAWSGQRDLDSSRIYALAWQARSDFEQGRWAAASQRVEEVIAGAPQHVPAQIIAYTVLGRLRARRGDPDVSGPLATAWRLAQQTGDLQRLWPAVAARAEAEWMSGGGEPLDAGITSRVGEAAQLGEDLAAEVRATYELALRLRHPWAVGELGCWLGVELPDFAAAPYRTGEGWRELGCPFEAALVLAAGDDPERQVAGLQELQQLGARAAADLVARQLRREGLVRLPRGPRPTTRENPAGLTDRETEVLALVAQQLRNTEIGARLHISAKTVDHHVSAVLGKLGVSTRQEAGRWFRAFSE
ncbi:helix-turn-helix transcriptional regulator [Kribbella sp. ALI-6-A]|uniref:helix-turn-helix transcriptional regulator n=1 Tax=Kribbella sp. ALI-6-A TaxID=1933817 RepID=UPI00117B0F24|nr:LuxR family transcriptional regulator [Kribbella sp. ALI-6-A]